jgi:hypothetical protein
MNRSVTIMKYPVSHVEAPVIIVTIKYNNEHHLIRIMWISWLGI